MVIHPEVLVEGYDPIVSITSFQKTMSSFTAELCSAAEKTFSLSITCYDDSLLRYTLNSVNTAHACDTGMIAEDLLPLPLSVKTKEGDVTVSSGKLVIPLTASEFSLKILSRSGIQITGDNTQDIDGLGRRFHLPLGYIEKSGAWVQSFRLRQDEMLFGLGEKFLSLQRVGQEITTWTQDAFGSTSERSHKNIPFLLSSKGYGIFINSGARIRWQLGTVSRQSFTVTTEDTVLDVFVIIEKTPLEILQRFIKLTGMPALPPDWTFGLWLSSCGVYRDRESIIKLIEGAYKNCIPASVMHIDPWWMYWRKYCDFVWNDEAFHDPQEFISLLHESGYKISLWEHPYISVETVLYKEASEKNYFLKRKDGSDYVIEYGLSLAPCPDGIVRMADAASSWNAKVAIIDLTNPEAYRWYKDLHRPLLRMGIDVFKTDFGEDIPVDAVFYNGETGTRMHNLYPLLYNKAVFEVTQEEHGQGVVWSRSGTAGNQRYPVCWSGDPASDFDSLACTLRGGLSAALSGIVFWSHDIGGYRGSPSAHLFIRWAQFGLFSSHSRMHGDTAREPWQYDEETIEIVRKYVHLRESLMPYILRTARKCVETGTPFIRPIFLEYPEEPAAYFQEAEYMFGESILAAPVVDESFQKTVYFPKGNWIDFFTGKVYKGKTFQIVKADVSQLPLYVKQGSIIPRQRLTAQGKPNGLAEFLIYPIRNKSVSYTEAPALRIDCTETPEQISIQFAGLNTAGTVFTVHSKKPVIRGVVQSGGETQDVVIQRHNERSPYYEIFISGMHEGELLLAVRK